MLAWLHTSDSEADKKKKATRADKFGRMITMPEIDYTHLIDVLWEAGPGINTGYGLSVMPWQEIEAFCRLSGVALSHWEARLLRRMSRIYCSGLNRFDGVQCDAPRIDA